MEQNLRKCRIFITLLIVSDELSNLKIYQYTGGVPTYKEIVESEAIDLIIKWLETIFEQVPKEVDTNSFYFHLSLLKYIASVNFITKPKFYALTPVGAYFQDVAAVLKANSPQVYKVPYGPDLVSPEEIISAPYNDFEYHYDAELHEDGVTITNLTRDFLDGITGGSE